MQPHDYETSYENNIRKQLSDALAANALLIAENRRLRVVMRRLINELREAESGNRYNFAQSAIREGESALSKHGSQS